MAGAEHKITSSGETVTVECSGGGDIDVETDDVDLTVTGDCEDIEIDGNTNKVTGGAADKIDIEGDGNTATSGSVEEVSVDGDRNTIEVEETRDIDVQGDDNTITYQSGDPSIETEGNNSVSAS
ncbi:DUF3060 domain-containing protein [Arthrobacter sp. PL16]|uniref:DUF3060 domain-containing protein n=1 Tax=Arthrobacter sp. PL16 TaxID=3071720 RepID=UPI002E167283